MSTIQIANITTAITALEYDGTEGYVVEADGEYEGEAATLADAQALAARLHPGIAGWVHEAGIVDWAGRLTWTAQ